VATPLLRRRLGLPVPVVTALSFQAPMSLALATPRTPMRDAGIYALQMWAYYAHYDMPDDDPVRQLRRTRVNYPIVIDRALGGGEVPTVRLQRAWGTPGRIRPHDLALSIVHWAWFFFPHATLGYLLVKHPRRFPRAAGLTAATFDAGLVFYWALPTAPPWYAGEIGRVDPVRRIMVETGERFWGPLWPSLYDGLQGNPFAAMPSLHFGSSLTAARLLSEAGRLPGVLGWTYTLTLGFGLVYLGEHYVVDLLAGLALSEGVRRAAPAVGPAVQVLGRGFQHLEPGAG